MRYVPISCVKVGMTIAKSMYNTDDKLLIRAGHVIREQYLDRMKEIGYQGIYIEDDLSDGVEIKDIISDSLRRKAAYSIKNMFESMENAEKQKTKDSGIVMHMDETKALMNDIVYDIMNNKDALVNMVDIKVFDEYTFFHSVNVAILSIVIGTEMGLTQEQLYNLGLAGVLHDIGKVYIDKAIVNKKGRLTDEEFSIMKNHPELGYKHLKETYEIPITAYVGVLQHHERFDGKGYPMNKKGDEIALFGRIICIADVYDAITSNRPYRDAMLPSEAIEYIMGNSGAMFDGEIVKVFMNKIAAYPVGTMIRLSNQKEALVVGNKVGVPLRPVVRIIDGSTMTSAKPTIIDLSDMSVAKSITVVEVLS